MMLFFVRRIHVPGKLRYQEDIVGYGLMGAFFYLALRYLIGFAIKEIALSPYDLSPRGIMFNLLDIIPEIVALEMLRAYLIGYIFQRAQRMKFWLGILTFMFALRNIPYNRIATLQTKQQWFVYIATEVLPAFALSGLLTTLVMYGDYKAGLIYVAIIRLFPRLFPFLPNLPWLAESVAGIAFPIVFLLYIRDYYQERSHRRDRGNMTGFIGSITVLVLFGWFIVGVFPVYPSVILTGSMEPGIKPGDVILIEKITKEADVYQLKEAEIISFRREDILITHRIHQVVYDKDENISFETKGDNNNVVDNGLLQPNDIRGRVRLVIPKIGKLLIWFRTQEPIPEGVIDDV